MKHLSNFAAAIETLHQEDMLISPLQFARDHNSMMKEIAQLAGGALAKANTQIAKNVEQKLQNLYG